MSGTCKILDKVNVHLGEWIIEWTIFEIKRHLPSLTCKWSFPKVRFWTRHTYKVWFHMMICTYIRKPSNKSSCRDIIKCEIGISLERISSQLRTLLGSMPIFITQLYGAIITTKKVTLLPKISGCSRGRTRGEINFLLSKLLTWNITVSAEVLGWAIAMIFTIIVAAIVMSPALTKPTPSTSIETKMILHKKHRWLLRWSW